MKKIYSLTAILFFSVMAVAQPSTEIYLFDLNKTETGYDITNPLNISDNEGYDNQPSFTRDGNNILFASTRNEQTDIVWYNIENGKKRWITETEGGEYSPVLMPDQNHISAVRLDPNGFQRLYKYSIESGESEILVPELVIGYYTWFLQSKIVAFVLGEPPTLQEIDIVNYDTKTVLENPGRSIHYIPGTKNYSFIDKTDDDSWKIMEAVPGNSKWTKEITSTLDGSEDMAWLNMHTIIMGKDDRLYSFDTLSDTNEWSLFADLSDFGLTNITRLAVYSDKIAIVVNGK